MLADLALQMVLVVLGLALLFNPDVLTDPAQIASTPPADDLVFAFTLAIIAFAGLDASSGLAGQVAVSREGLKRLIAVRIPAAIMPYVGVALVASSVLPQKAGQEQTVEAPMLAIVDAFEQEWLRDPLRYLRRGLGVRGPRGRLQRRHARGFRTRDEAAELAERGDGVLLPHHHPPLHDRDLRGAEERPWPRARRASGRPKGARWGGEGDPLEPRAAAAISRRRAASGGGAWRAAAQARPVRRPATAGTPASAKRAAAASSSSSGRVAATMTGTGLAWAPSTMPSSTACQLSPSAPSRPGGWS